MTNAETLRQAKAELAVVEGIIDDIINWILWLLNQVNSFVGRLVTTIVDWFVQWITSIIDWLGAALTGLLDWFYGLLGQVIDYFNSLLDWLTQYVGDLIEQLFSYFQALMDHVSTFVANVWANLQAKIEIIVSAVRDWIDRVADAVMGLIQEGLDWIAQTASAVKDAVVGWIEQALTYVLTTYRESVDAIRAGLQSLLSGANSLISSIGARLANLRDAFADAAEGIVEGIAGTGEGMGETLSTAFKDTFAGMAEWIVPDEIDAMLAQMQTITSGEHDVSALREFVQKGWQSVVPRSPVWVGLFVVIAVAAGMIPLVMQLSGASASLMMQEFGKTFPYALLGPGDVSAAYRRGLVGKERAIDTIRRQGHSTEDATAILALAEAPPGEADLLSMWHRGLLTGQDLDTALHQKGLTPEFQRRMKQASFVIPGVADLILMAVREVFSPDVTARFRQFEDYPEELSKWTKKQGLSEEWARNYWAAHWSLPSPNQGFEMFHRGVIREPDLKLLMRALDIMPGWRDELIKIAYAPFTRVDVRRMHKIGVLTDEEVQKAYKDIGYDEAKSAALLEFTKLYNEPPKADDDVELGALSRSAILGFYDDGLINRVRAQGLLEGIGYTEDAARLYLDSVDFQQQRDERRDMKALVLDRALAGLISTGEAANELRALGLETVEVERAMTRLARLEEGKLKLPTRAEALRLAKEGILSPDDYETFLGVLGYAPFWVRAYMAELEVSFRGDQTSA